MAFAARGGLSNLCPSDLKRSVVAGDILFDDIGLRVLSNQGVGV